MRALVTGGNGFVGRYLCRELRSRGIDVFSTAQTTHGGDVDLTFDLADDTSVATVLERSKPSVIFHLAAQAFVPQATSDPLGTYETNVMGTARLIDSVRALQASDRPRFVFVSSGEVYGSQAAPNLPLLESTPTAPATPYAASKVAGEAIVLASARTYGFEAIVTRAFNHIGPGQSDRFVVASFAKRLAQIAEGDNALFPVGNLTPSRDFLDVRDVVRAYADLATAGTSGEIYNVCSGVPTKIQDVLRHLVMAARVGVEIREDPALVRAVDVPLFYGDNAKLRAATGWEPKMTLPASLRDVYAAARATLASA